MLLVHDATMREPKLKETAAYSQWAVKNQDLIMQSLSTTGRRRKAPPHSAHLALARCNGRNPNAMEIQ